MTRDLLSTAGARVLVVEDDPDMREYATRLLDARYEVEAVDDGLAALDAARARRPDLVLADVLMPRVDGFALLAAIRADPELRTVPVILLSARKDEESRVQGLDAGADDYLVKPLSPRELLARVEGALRLDQLRRATVDALRAGEARQEFLLALSDALRPLADPVAIQNAAMKLLAEHLHVERAAYYEMEADQNTFSRTAGYETAVMPLPRRMRLSDFGDEFVAAYRAGRTIVYADTYTDPLLTERRPAYEALGVRAMMGVPLVKDGRLVSAVGVNSSNRREWTTADAQLLEEVAERTWSAVERARAESALRESERQLRIAMEAGQLYTWDIDLATNAVRYSDNAERLRGIRLGNVHEQLAAVHPEDREIAARALADAAEHGDRVEYEVRALAPGGGYGWFEASGTLVRDGQDKPVRAVGITRNVTVQRQAEKLAERERLAAARDELRVSLAAAEEVERRRIARELHDQLGQHLTGLALGLAEARRRIGAGESIDGRLEQLEELAKLMTRDARSLALELRPPELDDVGLGSALETYVRAWGTRRGISTDVAIFGVVDDMVPPDVGSALYRITQEALTNVARHAAATQVSVILERPDGAVQLLVEDDGCGFDMDAVGARIRSERRLGLAGMHERAALVGGTVAIESSPGVGTTLLVRVPVRTSHPGVPADATATAEIVS